MNGLIDELDSSPPIAADLLGNPLCKQVEQTLDSMRPYPGDPVWEARDLDRFWVTQINDEELIVVDNITGDEEILPIRLALRPGFMMGRWYAIKRTQKTRVRVKPLPRWHKALYEPKFCYAKNIAWRLTNREEFEESFWAKGHKKSAWKRFRVELDEYRGTYHVWDQDLDFVFDIPIRAARDPRTNITRWYYRRISKEFLHAIQLAFDESDDWGLSGLFDNVLDDDLYPHMLELF
ncbi:hypothetical protein CVT24_011142, partial [Panaeolus cyanescens]